MYCNPLISLVFMRPKLMTIFLHTGWCRDFYCIIVIFFKSVPLIRVTSLKIAMCTLQFAVFLTSVPLGTAMEKGVEEVGNFATEKAGSGHGKMKTGFQSVYHTWEKGKN